MKCFLARETHCYHNKFKLEPEMNNNKILLNDRDLK